MRFDEFLQFVYFCNVEFCRIFTFFPPFFEMTVFIMCLLAWWQKRMVSRLEYYGKKPRQTISTFLAPRSEKKTLREILTGFTLICLVNRSTKGKEKCLPNMLLGVKLFKRGEFRAINGGNLIHPYLLFCGVKNLQLLPSKRLWQHSRRLSDNRTNVSSPSLCNCASADRIDRIFGQNYIFYLLQYSCVCIFGVLTPNFGKS